MGNGQRSPIVSQYVWLMRGLAVLYALGAVIAFFFPAELFYLINVGPKVFKITEAIADPAERFWLVMAVCALTMEAMVCLMASFSPKQAGYALIHLASKVVGVAGFVYFFLSEQKLFAYAVGAGFDGLIGLIAILSYLRAAAARPVVTPEGAAEGPAHAAATEGPKL